LGQSFCDIEVICVDDGSADRSGEILSAFQIDDPRVRVITATHAGQSAARNRALRESHGRYVYFLDSDDVLEDGTLAAMYEHATKRDLDIFCFDGTVFFDEPRLKEEFGGYESQNTYFRANSYSEVVTGIEMFTQMHRNDEYPVSVCLQLFRRDFLVSHGLTFQEGIIYEDNIFTFECWMAAERVSHENLPLFRRRIRPGSTVTSAVTFANFFGYFMCWCRIAGLTMRFDLPRDTALEVRNLLTTYRSRAIRFQNSLPTGQVSAELEKQSPLLRYVYDRLFDSNDPGREIQLLRSEIAAIKSSRSFRAGLALTSLPRHAKQATMRMRRLLRSLVATY